MSFNKQKLTIFFTVFLATILVGIIGIVLYRNQAFKFINKPATVDSQANVDDLLKKVDKLIVLPNERPAVATVVAADELKDKPFFAEVKNGDKVLFFQNTRKAILYRPSINKIVNVALISQSVIDEASQGAETTQDGKVTLAIYYEENASQEAESVENQLAESLPQIEVVEKSPSADSYASSFVIDLEGGNSELVAQLAEELNAQVSSFPAQENRPNAQVLLILAQ